MTRRGWLLFAAMSLIWGIPYLLIKVAVGDFSPATLVFARTAVGAACLLPFALRRGQLGAALARWRPLLVYTAVEVAVPWVLLSDAERRLPSSLSGLLVAAVPLVAAVAVMVAGRRLTANAAAERLTLTRAAGLVVGIGGVAALLGLDVRATDPRSLLEVAAVVVGYAVGPMIASRQLADVPPLGVVAASLTICSLVYLPAAVIDLPRRMPPAAVLASVLVLGLVCTALAFVLFLALIAEAGPTRATLITYLNPAVAVVLGVVFLDERFGWGTGLGFALILTGCWLASRRPRRRARLSPPVPSTAPRVRQRG